MKAIKYSISVLSILAIVVVSCTDPEPEVLAVSSIEAVGTSFADGSTVTKDLNGAASAADVALNSNITITFDRAVDAGTVNISNISVSSDDGDVEAAVTSSGSSVSLDPNNDLIRGTAYTLNISGNLKSTDGGAFMATTRTFNTEGRAPVIVPNADQQIAYWNFDNNTDDVLGNFNPDNVVEIIFGEDRFGQGGSAASFDGDESLIEIPNGDQLMASDDFTLSFWMKTNSNGHVDQDGNPSGYFVMGLGAFFGFQFEVPADFGWCKFAASYVLENGDAEYEDIFFNGDGMDKDNGGWQGDDFVASLGGAEGVQGFLKDTWINIICTYNANERQGQIFFNGELMKSQDFDLWKEGDPQKTITGVSYTGTPGDVEPVLAFGFIKSADSPMWAETPWGDYYKPTSNHFKGDLDDVRVFKSAFSPADVATLYNSEK